MLGGAGQILHFIGVAVFIVEFFNGKHWSSTLWYRWRRRTAFDSNEGVKGGHGADANLGNILFVDGHAELRDPWPINFTDANNTLWNPDASRWGVSF